MTTDEKSKSRISLYIPPHLKAEMEQYPEINWSFEFQKLVRRILKTPWPSMYVLEQASLRKGPKP